MSDEPSSPPDLAAIDLSLSFAPAWAKETDASKQIARLAARHGGGDDRPERSGKRWEDRGPRPDRGPRRNEGAGARGGKRPGGGGRPERRDDRRPEREPRPAPPLGGWTVQFLPDRHGVEGLARQIKTAAKAYPLFDLARLVLEKSERYLVEFKRAAPEAPALFQLKTDGTLWLNEGDAIASAITRHLDKFYRRERIAVDPPKGVYPFVAVCGMSGTLLGPPNYHDYQSKIRQLHAERFASMPFEAFKNRIRMDRDEAAIARWKEEQSARDVYYPVEENAVAEPAAEAVEPAEIAPLPEAEAPAPAAGEDPSAESAPAAAESPAPRADGLATLAEVERHFRQHHAARLVVKIRERVVVPGPAALNDSASPVLLLTRGIWEELDRFPLPLAHNLGQQLVGRGLQIFKAHDNITYVGVARPKYLDRQITPVSESLGGILDYLEGHASTPRAEQIQALVALRPAPAEGAEDDREAAVARDLSWLLHEGHVVDYIKRGLEAARRPKPPTPKKPPKARDEPKAAAPAVEPPPAPAPEAAAPGEPGPAAEETSPASAEDVPVEPEPDRPAGQ